MRVLLFILLLMLHIHTQSLYNHQPSTLSQASWMGGIDGGVPIRQLSIMGTHSSMSQGTWGDAFQTQSNSLTNQMTMGFRAFDIRCNHNNNQLFIYDRLVYLNTDLNAVFTTIANYLNTHPS